MAGTPVEDLWDGTLTNELYMLDPVQNPYTSKGYLPLSSEHHPTDDTPIDIRITAPIGDILTVVEHYLQRKGY